ncbi:MAG: hypothetical protein BWY09_02619 [Candidatus Hydrogenedentes bacterium ADurb.Bin179]|nr:MAG: hypothetical protein BWY09_02619 [Candidatus Hydrogenedentes bacterium ADurb.Bin179]
MSQREPQIPQMVQRGKRGGRVAAAAGQSRRDRNALVQMDERSPSASGFLPEQRRGATHKIGRSHIQSRPIARQGKIFVVHKGEFIVKTDGLEYRFNIVVTVTTFA